MTNYQMNQFKSFAVSLLVLLLFVAFQVTSVWAAPGDLITTVTLPDPGFGVSVAVGCDGVVYYTNGDSHLHSMDKDGNHIDSVPTNDSVSGNPVNIDEMSYDKSRDALWGVQHDSNPEVVYLIDPSTGVSTLQFTSSTNSVGSYRDGLAYDATDDSVWISGDVSSTIDHYQTDGTYLGQITPKDAAGNALGEISGVQVGLGDLLYLGRDGYTQIVQVKKSDGSFIESFASAGGSRDEGLECDPVNFAPKLALWSRDVNNFMAVIELEPDTCACGGGFISVSLDIKPGSCPNPFNSKSQGNVPVAIVGTDNFDVTTIDLSKPITLSGVPAKLDFSYGDVTQPGNYDPADCSDCFNINDYLVDTDNDGIPDTYPGDGHTDLVVRFDTQALADAIESSLDPSRDDCIVLTLEATNIDGVPITGQDSVIWRQ